MDIEKFKKWTNDKNIKERTIDSFWYYIKNYEKEDYKEFKEIFRDIDINLINVRISTIALTLNYRFDEVVEYIVVFLIIEYKGEEIGEYESLFTLDGEDLDDYLRIKK